MSIRALGFEVICDECGDHSIDTPQGAPSRSIARGEARTRGWRWFRHNGKNTDMCENCIDALKETEREGK